MSSCNRPAGHKLRPPQGVRAWRMIGMACAFGAVSWLAIGGCGKAGYKLAPVSGRVTLDGKPLANIHITFQPVAVGENLFPGPGSFGRTDSDGRFVLNVADKPPRPGAVVGKHRVTLAPVGEASGEDDEVVKVPNPIPAKYREKPLEFEVPAGGTDKADFDLTSK
ncbi:MAG: hypothetical protein ACUVUC_16255 [Thermoguttaceae bacterium]